MSRRGVLKALALAMIAPGAAVATTDHTNDEQPNRPALEASLGPLEDWEIDARRPDILRWTLAGAALYPTFDSTGNSAYDVWESLRRARLHQAIDALSRPDLDAVSRVMRLLVLSSPDPALFDVLVKPLGGGVL